MKGLGHYPLLTHPSCVGLTAFYSFSRGGSKCYDLISKYTGTLSAVLPFVGSPYGGALDFDGTNRLDVPSVFKITTSLSIFIVLNIPTLPTKGCFVKIGNISTGLGIGLSNGGASGFESAGSNITILSELIAWLPTGVTATTGWQTIAGTFNQNSTIHKMYVNGALRYTSGAVGINAPSTQSYIGGYTSGAANRHFDGPIDSVRIYNRCLADAEIASLNTNPYQGFELEMAA